MMLTICLCCLLGVGEANKNEAVEAELKRLEGRWYFVATAFQGADVKVNTKDRRSMTIKGKSMLAEDGDKNEFPFEIDPTTSPKSIDFVAPTGKIVFKGIYDLDGDQLRTCMVATLGQKDVERPTDFALREVPGQVNVTYHRKSPAIPAADADKQARDDIQKVLDAQAAAWNKGDLEGYMAGYWKSKDLSFYGGREKTSGWKETLERYRKKYQAGGAEMGKLTFSEVDIEVLSPECAVVRGRWQLEMKEKKPDGLFTLIMKKQKEGWRVVHDHSS